MHSTATAQSAPPSGAPLQTFREILIARSDGVGYTTQQINDASRSTQPVGEALDERHDFVRSWTVKLGKAIKYNLGASGAADPSSYLVRFPQGYSLHVRPGKTRDRDGPFVFGHPLGPIAAYRSPAELALHVLWLMSNSASRADCSCRLCVRMVSESEAQRAPPPPAPQLPQQAQAQARAQAQPQPAAKPAPKPPATVTPVPIPVVPTAAPPKPPAPAAPSTDSASTPFTLPAPVPGGSALFRPWELVWYHYVVAQGSQGTWRLGIVLQVHPAAGPAAPPSAMPGLQGTVLVAPLGIPGMLKPETLDASALRPFLSFSVPAMREGLQGLSYDQINWKQLLWEANQQQQPQQQEPGHYDVHTLSLEASKSAANQINACFSVFNAMPKASADQCLYGGVFLGAEQVLVGDALRVVAAKEAPPPPTTSGSADPAAAAAGPSLPDVMRVNVILTDNGVLSFLGDVYRLAVAGRGGVAAANQPPNPQPEGQVFAEELAERNGRAGGSDMYYYWQLRERNGRRAEGEVHGRFYASTRLAANLQNAALLQQAQQPPQQPPQPLGSADGRVMLAASGLNRRLHVAGLVYQGMRANRMATVGQAISVPLPAIEGVKELA